MAKKRADGRLQKKFTVNGKQYFVYGRNTQELFKAEQAKREAIERGYERRNNPTLSEYYEKWSKARHGCVKETTLRSQDKIYGVASKIYIHTALRNLGEIKIKEISIDDLRTVQAELLKTRITRTVNDYMAFINHLMRDALKERIIDYNPCCLLNSLKRTEETARDTNHRALTKEEVKAFFECDRCKKSSYYNVFRLAINTGMRSGEIGALKYSDIRKDSIHIERTITRTETGAYTIGEEAKTKAGRRIIPMNDQIREIIKDQKELNRLLYGECIPLDDCLFKSPNGGLLSVTQLDRDIKRICTAADIESFSMHAFRATFATRAIESEMSIKTLQELLGHTNFNLTMSLYGHCMTDTKKEAMEKLKMIL